MTSGFSGGYPDSFNANRGGVRNVSGRSGVFSDSLLPVDEPRSDLNRKRSLIELHQQQASVYLRNMKPRLYNQQTDLSSFSSSSPVCTQIRRDFQINDYYDRKQPSANKEMDGKILNRLRELEKELLLDDEEVENDSVSVTVSPKQLISNVAEAITDGRSDIAIKLLTRLNQFSNARGNPEQRLSFHMACALHARLRVNTTSAGQSLSNNLSTLLLYDQSPCFKLAFMAANNVILQTSSVLFPHQTNIHVVDFDIGHGIQYVYLINAIAAARKGDYETTFSLKVTTFKDTGVERLKRVGDGLKSVANKLGVTFHFNVLDFNLSDVSRQGLAVATDDILAVNFSFKLNKLPDESVTTENPRDEILRRVKGLSPAVVTVLEQELNTNTASFTARVNELFSYYSTFVKSFDASVTMENAKRVKIEEGLSRRIVNSVACEGRDRVERCEVFGKWRARMRMAGFDSKPVCADELLLSKLNFGTRGNPGFTVKEDSGGICIGWLGRTLTVVSAWH